MKRTILHILLLCCISSSAANISELQKQLRDVTAIKGRHSMEYALAMSKMGEYYADTLNADYSKHKALSYFTPATNLAMELGEGTVQCADVLLPYLKYLICSLQYKSALPYAKSLFNIFENAAAKLFPKMSHTEILQWLELHKSYSDILFAILDRNELSKAEEDMLYDMCLIEKGYLSLSQYEPHVGMIRFADIEQVLKPNEVAVEFASYDFGGRTFFVSSRLRHGWHHPKKQSICEHDTQLKVAVLHKTFVNKREDIGELIWGNLVYTFKNDEHIYFSPAGDLHLMGIEYCKIPGSRVLYMSDVYYMHRMFSTARLIVRSKANLYAPVKTAALFGSINYGDGKWPELTQTASEVNTLERILKESGYITEKRMQQHATARSFLDLSRKKTGIIHIATHGFTYFKFLSSDPLHGSGLVMAYGNDAFFGDTVDLISPNILTPAMIDSMNITGTRLVVLSACRSGLGIVKADNLTGLQSALCNAGAGAVMTSLWDVNDDATSVLMKEFYRNYLTTAKSFPEALRSAQQKVRKQSFAKNNTMMNGRDPKFWAAFVIYE